MNHQEFSGRIIWGVNTISNTSSPSYGLRGDDYGHGTAVAGVAAGRFTGIAKGVKIIAVKALDNTGSAEYADILSAMDWILADIRRNPRRAKAHIVNMSWGGPIDDATDDAVKSILDAKYENGAKAEVYVTMSGGNGFPSGDPMGSDSPSDSCLQSPSHLTKDAGPLSKFVVSMGGSDVNDGYAFFSSSGACIDALAPATRIFSAGFWENNVYTDITKTMGTSYAAPQAAGALALIASCALYDVGQVTAKDVLLSNGYSVSPAGFSLLPGTTNLGLLVAREKLVKGLTLRRRSA
jgi:subtilisin family serine protease